MKNYENYPIYSMLAIITVVCTCCHGGVPGDYKRQWVGILDASFLPNMRVSVTSAITLYCHQSCGDAS